MAHGVFIAYIRIYYLKLESHVVCHVDCLLAWWLQGRSRHLCCRREGCGYGRARVTMVHALQMQCQAIGLTFHRNVIRNFVCVWMACTELDAGVWFGLGRRRSNEWPRARWSRLYVETRQNTITHTWSLASRSVSQLRVDSNHRADRSRTLELPKLIIHLLMMINPVAYEHGRYRIQYVRIGAYSGLPCNTRKTGGFRNLLYVRFSLYGSGDL